MDDDFFAYLERLQVLAFFSGFAILYALLHVLAELQNGKLFEKIRSILPLLPISYALTGLLFLGYLIKGVVVMNIQIDGPLQIDIPYIHYAGLLSLLFWVPAIRQRAWLSLLHSLFFFSIIGIDLVDYMKGNVGVEVLQNDSRVFVDSLLTGIFTISIVILLKFLHGRIMLRQTRI